MFWHLMLRTRVRPLYSFKLNRSLLPRSKYINTSTPDLFSETRLFLFAFHTFSISNCQDLENSTAPNVTQLCSHGRISECVIFSCNVAKIVEIIIQTDDIEVGLDGLGLKTLTIDIVCEVLRTLQRKFLKEITQKDSRQRFPIIERCLWKEAQQDQSIQGSRVLRNPLSVKQGVDKALRFYSWAGKQDGFTHVQLTCQEMAWTLARANLLKTLWRFLHEMARKESGIVTTKTVTSVIKVLGEEGLVKEALACFYRMKQFHCKPDSITYNTIINALCRAGNFSKARFLFYQMKMPGSRCPPDAFTYTILITCYCKHSMHTSCRKAVNKRLQEANRLFKEMCYDGFMPDVVTYNCLIDGLCKNCKIDRALEIFRQMHRDGCAPNKVTYNSFIRYYSTVNEVDKAMEMLNKMEENNISPTCSSYTPIVHALCEGGRLEEGSKVLIEMVVKDSVPRSYTYKLVTDALRKAGKDGLPAEVCRKIELGIEARDTHVKRVKGMVYT